jgi:hypothetical protein
MYRKFRGKSGKPTPKARKRKIDEGENPNKEKEIREGKQIQSILGGTRKRKGSKGELDEGKREASRWYSSSAPPPFFYPNLPLIWVKPLLQSHVVFP